MPHLLATLAIAAIWITFGLYFKLLNQVPRHRQIVARILGPRRAHLTPLIGLAEILLGLWALTRYHKISCALTMTAAIVTMNTLELLKARDLLLSPKTMLLANLLFLTLIWTWALTA